MEKKIILAIQYSYFYKVVEISLQWSATNIPA